jgi:D-alanyl-lipoteichoic acid acyltransferase DltB (MBOAT superfamily)
MARGVGRMFGINLTENFNHPYLATSIADFWRRWHISFSRWILDYIFKPLQLGWRNWEQAGTAIALIITFFISGIWHGASWGFVIWGMLHGIYLAASIYYKPYQKRLYKLISIEKSILLKWWQIFITFNLVCIAWIFFRANTLNDAWYVITNLIDIPKLSVQILRLDILSFAKIRIYFPNISLYEDMVLILAVIFYMSLSKFITTKEILHFNAIIRWLIYLILVNIIVYFDISKYGQFIYAQF